MILNYFDKFEILMQNMNVPHSRKQATSVNALWFLQEGSEMNKNHPGIMHAIFLARKIA